MNTIDNVDENELKKFASLADAWWDPNGPLKTLHEINPIRVKYIEQTLQETHEDLSQLSLLDVGCGAGLLTEALAKFGMKVSGIDLNASLIAAAEKHQASHLPQVSICYQVESVHELAKQSPGSFDIVTCLELLEHVPDPRAIVHDCAALLKPGGHLFLSTLNRHPKAYFFAVLCAEYLLNLLPKQTHDYEKFIRPSELAAWAREASITPKAIRGLTYRPFSKKHVITNDTSVNYLLYGVKNT